MRRPIDPKYSIVADDEGIEIANAQGVFIPPDEPVILFRGRDRLALPMLEHYRNLCMLDGCTDFHMRGIDNRIAAFKAFAATSATMKQPGITEGK